MYCGPVHMKNSVRPLFLSVFLTNRATPAILFLDPLAVLLPRTSTDPQMNKNERSQSS